jgi:hypothetical protein
MGKVSYRNVKLRNSNPNNPVVHINTAQAATKNRATRQEEYTST